MNLRALLLTAILGVLVAVGVALSAVSWIAVIVYATTALVVLAVLARRGRAALRDDGRTCSCCTSTVFDPVEVIR